MSAPSRAVVLLVAALGGAVFLQWIGSSAVLPLLPIYLQQQGSSTALVGMVMASFFATGVVAQVIGGRLGDRFGHRPMLVIGLLGYALASAAFALVHTGWGYLGVRAAQGAAAGVAEVACLALVARAVPAGARGRAYAAVGGAQLAGIAIGPMLGVWFGIAHMTTLFVISGFAAALAAIPVLASRASGADVAPITHADAVRLPRTGVAGRALAGALLVAVLGGALSGTYEACWSLLMHSKGATDTQIGLSWTLFALPFILLSPVAGWLADHRDRRVLVLIGLAAGSTAAAIYPFLPGPPWLMVLGMAESAGFALAMPAAQSLLTEFVPPQASGRAQGLFMGLETAAVAVAAAVMGGLFARGPAVPFVSVSVLAWGLLLLVPVLWRPVPGRVRPAGEPGEPEFEESGCPEPGTDGSTPAQIA